MKYCCLVLILVANVFGGYAQNEADTSVSKDCDSLKSINWLADSAYRSFRTERFSSLRTFYHSYQTYKLLIDTSIAGGQTEYTKFLMYQTRWNYLRIQYTKMIKKIHNAGIKWEKTVLDSVYFERGVDHGLRFAYVYWVIKYNGKRKHILSAVTVEINDKWYIMDELKYVGIVPEVKKKKKKK
ncbi:MAG: hypothetical protein V4613_13660 [Bacteroidota bacterium]